jgi:hypothetical protein
MHHQFLTAAFVGSIFKFLANEKLFPKKNFTLRHELLVMRRHRKAQRQGRTRHLNYTRGEMKNNFGQLIKREQELLLLLILPVMFQ